jgi:hypothetical protein
MKPTDAATNTATYDLAFTVDTIDPVVTFADPQNTFVATGSPTIDFSVSDASRVGTLACWAGATCAPSRPPWPRPSTGPSCWPEPYSRETIE